MLNFLPPELLRIVISAVIVVAFVFLNCMVLGYAETQVCRFLSDASRSDGSGPLGRFCKLIVDGIKLIAKQLIIPRDSGKNALPRRAAHCISCRLPCPSLLFPSPKKLQVRDMDIGACLHVGDYGRCT